MSPSGPSRRPSLTPLAARDADGRGRPASAPPMAVASPLGRGVRGPVDRAPNVAQRLPGLGPAVTMRVAGPPRLSMAAVTRARKPDTTAAQPAMADRR
jgi:hypothetical protein